MATISTVQELFEELEDILTDETTLFRGQREDWDLIPKIARITPWSSLRSDEKKMI